MSATLYRYFDSDGELLYVGITAHGHSRAEVHRSQSLWWAAAASATFEHHPNRAAALRAEAAAILAENPLYNVRGVDPAAVSRITAYEQQQHEVAVSSARALALGDRY